MGNINSHEEYNVESLGHVNKMQEQLLSRINYYLGKRTYNWLVSMFQSALDKTNLIVASIIQERIEKHEAYGKDYETGYKASENDYGAGCGLNNTIIEMMHIAKVHTLPFNEYLYKTIASEMGIRKDYR